MQPFSLGVTTLVQGLYTLMGLVVLVDVASPTFNLQGVPEWTGSQATVAAVVVFTASVALGVVMHTISRGFFHPLKQRWTFTVLSSDTVRKRMEAVGSVRPFPAGPTYNEIIDEDEPDRVRKAGALLHGIEYQVLARAPEMFKTIQIYRDQYRLARGFILPSAGLALVLPIWDPVRALDGAGMIGPFPIIRTQMFLVAVLAAAVSYVAFRERSHRYAAAKALAFVTLEGIAGHGEGETSAGT
jgi:hypothetical protein